MRTTRDLTPAEQRRIAKTLLFAAACLYLLACYLAYGQWRLNRTGIVAIGEVVSLTGKKGRTPIVRFEASDGQTTTFTERNTSDLTPMHVGDFVKVIYPPARPQEASIVATQWLRVKLCALFATVMGGLGLLALWVPGWKLVTNR